MKRIQTIFFALAVLLTACDKFGQDGLLTEFPAVVMDFAVKSALDPDTGGFSWQDGDLVRVFNGDNDAVFKYDADRDLFVVSEGALAKTGSYQAGYPADLFSFQDGVCTLSLPDTQVASKVVDRMPLYLWKVRDGVFKFKSICGLAKLQLVGSGLALYEAPLTKVTFTSTGGFASGSGTVGKDGVFTIASGEKTMTVDCPDVMTAGSPVFLTLPSQKYPMGSKVSFFFADGKVVESVTVMGIVPRPDMIKSYELEITADFFGPLEDFEDGGSIDDKF